MKPSTILSRYTFVAAISLAACAWLTPGTGKAEDNPQEQYNKEYRGSYEVPLGNYTGRSPYMQGAPMEKAPKPAPAPRPVPAPAPAPAPRTACSDPTWGLIHMSKTMPSEATLGANFTAELRLTAQACAGNVVVRDTVPAGASYVSSDPAATVDGNLLTWKFGDLDAGASRTIKITLKADREGTLVNCAVVSADPRVCASTIVGKATLAIEKTGPATALLGADVPYNIVVKNTGSAIARNVVVSDAVPEGMGGQAANVSVGDLAPGQSKNLTVNFKANKRGKVCNTAVATSSNAGKVSDEACTTVLVPGLKVEKSGTKEQFLTRNANYKVVVSNTGDTELKNVTVTDTAPSATKVVSASGANVSGNMATWVIPSLMPGEKKSFDVVLTTVIPGTHCNNVTASAGGLRDSAEACTVWKGISALLLNKGDDPDPIQVGEQTTYYVRVTNQGTADDTNIKIVVEFPKELTPVSADNGGTISGQTVTFPAYPRLAPKQVFEYHVKAKGVTPGDARVKFIRTSTDIPAPTTAEESTRVY